MLNRLGIGLLALAALAGTVPPQNTSFTDEQKQLVTIDDPGVPIVRVLGWHAVNEDVVTVEPTPDGRSAYVVSEGVGVTWVFATIETIRDGDSYFMTSAFKAEVLDDLPPELPFGFTFSTPIPK